MPDFRWPPPPERDPRRAALHRSPGQPGRQPPLPEPPTELVATPHEVDLEQLVTGTGAPVTVFATGLAQTIPHARPLGTAVPGRKVFFQFRGHGRSGAPPGRWRYDDLARDLRAVADLAAASQVVATSLGAGALCRLLADSPDRFDRLVFFLPAVLDQPPLPAVRERLTALLAAARSEDLGALSDVVAAELPPSVRCTRAGWTYLVERLDQLGDEDFGRGFADLPGLPALPDLSLLARVRAPALVLACAADPLHPVSVARRLAGVLPRATLHVYETPGVFWTDRRDLRNRIGEFLSG